jgi:hypothetical protein
MDDSRLSQLIAKLESIGRLITGLSKRVSRKILGQTDTH